MLFEGMTITKLDLIFDSGNTLYYIPILFCYKQEKTSKKKQRQQSRLDDD